MTPTSIVAYFALFGAVGFVFLFAALLLGRFLRPYSPTPEKRAVYECGEPAIGSSFVQFDLRFYVVALLFIIFDVEVAFFFPWATVFGKATHLMDPNVTPAQARNLYGELGVPPAALPVSSQEPAKIDARVAVNARRLAQLSLADLGVFFAALLVGFAYVWKRGDLAWVRAVEPIRAEGAEAFAAANASARWSAEASP
jgi:NADH-quinone oxidoreductase subunit A